MIKMENNFKKGDIVCVYNRYGNNRNREIHETEVISSGKKYITTKHDKSNKFDIDSLCSDWGGYALFKGTHDKCKEYLEKLGYIKEKCREISHYFDTHFDNFDMIEKVYGIVFPEKIVCENHKEDK
jgi:hypothetical protein